MAHPYQHVGHEFVRQYFTQLNYDPKALLGLYTETSTFLHDGLNGEEAIDTKGLDAIKEALSSLGFNDCRTKIEQINSSPGISNSVVILVIGEMSNNGNPMRKFVQTIVLGQKTQSKYYVQNMILRFQDELASEEPFENGINEPSAEEIQINEEILTEEQSTIVNEQSLSPAEDEESAPEPLVNGNLSETKEDDLPSSSDELAKSETSEEAAPTSTTSSKQEEPKSWAKLVTMSKPYPSASTTNKVESKPAPPKSSPKEKPAPTPSTPQTPNPPAKREEPPRRKFSPSTRYPDDQQLFVGNLALTYTEEELKNFFSQYGRVLDMKINKSNYQKNSSNKVPNFGYVVFEEAKSAQSVLSISPIYYNNRRINVEQKITKPRYSNRPRNGPQTSQNKSDEEKFFPKSFENSTYYNRTEQISDDDSFFHGQDSEAPIIHPERTWASLFKKYDSNQAYTVYQSRTAPAPKVDKGYIPNSEPFKKKVPPVESSISPDEYQVFVGNLANDITVEELEDLFKEHAMITKVIIRANPNPNIAKFGFVTFQNEKEARKVIHLNLVLRDRRVNIELKRRK